MRPARLLREAIDRAVLSAAEGRLPALADVDTINEAVTAAPRPLLQLVIADGRLAPRAERLAGDVAAGLGLVARDAAELLLSPEVGRVRVCGSDRCGLRFVDRSQAGRRRWCSMSRCGNRTKVKRHQERVRN
ncbi:CGNR zinc finger domain-containing protein [Nonomuraea thailandensis]